MKSIVFSILLGSCLVPSVQAQNYVSKVWVADQGDGTYKNPVLYADYSDPDVCRVGDDFYMTSSSFGCLPGFADSPLQRSGKLEYRERSRSGFTSTSYRCDASAWQPCMGSVYPSSQR